MVDKKSVPFVNSFLSMTCIKKEIMRTNSKSYVPLPMVPKLPNLDHCFKVIRVPTFEPCEIGHNFEL